ncbi:uncharacterized protein B0I36DRAFT_253759 [Microdochium trichocladiopsis]|uniref:Tat pathway signal sequence domain protein n=1 Tax=Microdochium trichocladiopsis TaxID=1682393 RepID=A0A9P8XX27_9PEZI|nr:uncharacterized protein B0I36DRAFT_253759 [Microdochium trichocladiopsis]KAH7018559.1 hypothetical protein B0I36DRAFT_253759 [Microdochium trichocladiopsis]
MHPALCHLVAALGCAGLAAAQSPDSAAVSWVGDAPDLNLGATFGLPWPRGKYPANSTSFTATDSNGGQVDVQSWITAYWPDGSVKWTGHAVGASNAVGTGYTVSPVVGYSQRFRRRQDASSMVAETGSEIVVNTGKISAVFKKSGNTIISSIKTASGKTVGTDGVLVLLAQSAIAEEDAAGEQPAKSQLNSVIEDVAVSKDNSVRTLVTIKGKHEPISGDGPGWLPFTVRFYLYKNSEAIKVLHTLTYDGTASQNFIVGIGIRFDVPLSDELYNRHIRLSSADGGLLNEAVKGITGLRRDPGQAVRTAQYEGKATPDTSTWDTRVTTRLQWIPNWNDYSLTQLSPDGFTLKKRTKAGQSWVKIPGGTKAGGLVYLGGAAGGGLGVGHRDFWKRYPTGIDIRNAASDVGQITLWLHSPAAGPMDLRPFHDGLGQDTYAKQLDALEITYEDYEGGYNTPTGIARTNELYIFGFDSTPSQEALGGLNAYVNEPPVLFVEPSRIKESGALGTYWGLPSNSTTGAAQDIEKHMDFLVRYYIGQVEQRRWYGFWDHGDIMHTYDVDRHQWRYDIGGYAWDNSELSPDIFFWNYFLRTGRADVYRLAEAQVRHGGDVDVYHLGNFTGLGTRHGVDHWSDSAKQIRISTTIYRRVFYYISGGDERTGDLVAEVQKAEQAFVAVDARRKIRDPSVVYVPDPEALYISLGLDWVSLAGAWLIEWERRGPNAEAAQRKLLKGFEGIAALKNGFVTGEALYNSSSGAISAPPTDPDNKGIVVVSHLDAVFGLQEVLTQVFDHVGQGTPSENPKLPAGFLEAWLDYCYYYSAGKPEQAARYGKDFGSVSLIQGHSKLTAYAAWKTGNATLASRAWKEFFGSDGLKRDGSGATNWTTVRVEGSKVLTPVDEASWLSTNDMALYGVNAIENLFFVGQALGST